ncbi:hypothetical protein BU23DRAFT_625601 [Bimuria novae-zelandiae CBS 107.79]|uniref:Uncharacterized protein n=1 Tax=Bimuria novae-zelandiae CBS 107.79 TaxID=1447943 RepID=A0A6A5VZQ0_9PLEO|nr:hypothetical protein BU23DRAFT_625601 [Bimuria novae-zelandiae CBS 107.79]
MLTAAPQEFQQRLAAIVAEAHEQSLDLNDVVPPQLLDQLAGVTEHANSKQRIAALEGETKEMKEMVSKLKEQLAQAQQAVENMDIPEDRKQMQVDLDQANRAKGFYRDLMKQAEDRALHYQDKMKAALDKQVAVEDADKKIARLEQENFELRQHESKLAKELQKMKQVNQSLDDRSLAMLEDKESKIMDLKRQLRVRTQEYNKLSEDNSAVENQWQELMTSLDSFNADITTDLNAAAERHRATEQQLTQQLMTTVSKIRPLRRFYAQANDILNMYQSVFKQLLNATEQNVTYQSDFKENLLARLQAAGDEVEISKTLQAVFTTDGVDHSEDNEQLGELAESANSIQKSLNAIGHDVIHFLWALERRPDIRRLIRHKFSVWR